MRAIIATIMTMCGLAAALAQEPPDMSGPAPGVSLGKPVPKRAGQASDEGPASGTSLPTLGKPTSSRPKLDTTPTEPPPGPGRQPIIIVDERPALQAVESPVKAASFSLPGAGEHRNARAAATMVEMAPPPHERPARPLLAAPGIRPLAGSTPTLSPGVGSVRPATWWERLSYRAKNLGGADEWVPVAEKSYPMPVEATPYPDMYSDPCCLPTCHQWYGSAEYLVWQMRDLDVPALLTTSTNPSVGNPPGALGQPGTVVVFGGEVDYGHLSGARLTLGAWLDCCHTIGLEGSFFYLEEGQRDLSAGSDSRGVPFLGRPFFDEFEGRELVEPVAIPGVLAGRFDASFRTEFWGAELNLRKPMCDTGCWHCWCKDVHLLCGLRYLDLRDDIELSENLVTLVPIEQLPPGTRFGLFDQFESRNRFFGGQVGVEAQLRRGCWSIDLRTKLAMGVNRQEIEIKGVTLQTGEAPRAGGLLTQSTNIGHYKDDVFSIVSETGLNVGYQIGCRTRVFVGYQVLYWTNVARADQQIDRVVNQQLISGGSGVGTRPQFPSKDRDFWAHGLNVGVEVKY